MNLMSGKCGTKAQTYQAASEKVRILREDMLQRYYKKFVYRIWLVAGVEVLALGWGVLHQRIA